jgi:hypothetical protein
MSYVVMRRLNGIRLGALPSPSTSTMSTSLDNQALIQNAIRSGIMYPAITQPFDPRRINAINPVGTMPQQPTPSVVDTTSQIVDTDGQIVGEQRIPAPTDPALNAGDAGAQQAQAGVVTDISPSMVPSVPAWKIWLPIGVAVVGIGTAVWILRKKR